MNNKICCKKRRIACKYKICT